MSEKIPPRAPRKGAVSQSVRAGLQFPVGRIARFLKRNRYAARVGKGAPIYMAAVLEYVAAEILELAGKEATAMKRDRLNPRAIELAVRGDEDLSKLFPGTIAGGGVHPMPIPCLLLQKGSEAYKRQCTAGGKEKKRS